MGVDAGLHVFARLGLLDLRTGVFRMGARRLVRLLPTVLPLGISALRAGGTALRLWLLRPRARERNRSAAVDLRIIRQNRFDSRRSGGTDDRCDSAAPAARRRRQPGCSSGLRCSCALYAIRNQGSGRGDQHDCAPRNRKWYRQRRLRVCYGHDSVLPARPGAFQYGA